MARMIDADRLLRDPYFQEDRWPESHLIRMAVREQPTVDAVEVVHGRWEEQKEWNFKERDYFLAGYTCSCCGFWYLNQQKYNYCPNCGAKMDGGSDG